MEGSREMPYPTKETFNVVTEARFKELLEQGFRAEIISQTDADYRNGLWGGEWTMRIVDQDGQFEKLLVTVPRNAADNEAIKVRTFKTVNGLISFIRKLGLTHVEIPLEQGGRSSQALLRKDS